MNDKGTIEYLAYLLNKAKTENKDKAIVFLGAGVSVSAGIPLADTIVEDIKRDFSNNPLVNKHNLNGKTDYYDLMALLTADERRDLFHSYVTNEKVKLNVANVYLAQLLKEGYVDYIVTVNFDDLILKACTLFNFLPPVYDISNIKTTTTTDIRTGSVIYLHGQYFGQWLLNNKEELAEVEKEVLSFFNAIKTRRTWLVVGYSGNDGIFEKIKSLGSFSNELFWIKKKIEPKTDDHINTFLNTAKINAHAIEGYYADSFFLKLHGELSKLNSKLNHPDIFSKPFSYLKSVIGNVNDIQDDDELHKQVKAIINVCKDRIEKAIISFENEDSIETFKQQIIDALIKQDFSEKTAERLTNEMVAKNFLDAKEELGWYFNDWGAELSEKATLNQAENLLYDSIDKYKIAIELSPNNDTTYSNWGSALYELGRMKSEKKIIEESIEKYIKAIELNPTQYMAYNNWGNALCQIAELKLDEKKYEESIEKYKIAIEIKPNNYATFLNWGNALQGLATLKSDEDLYEKCFEKYKKAADINPKDDTIFLNWGNALQKLAILKSDESLFRKCFEKYREAIEVNPIDDHSFYNWGNALQKLAILKSDDKLIEESIEKYKIVIGLTPNDYIAFINLASAIFNLAKFKSDENLYKESIEIISKAVEINPKSDIAFNIWGNTLQELAKMKLDEELYRESFEKYKIAIGINSKSDAVFDSWSGSLLFYYYITSEDKENILKEAKEKAQKAYDLNPIRSYNLACCYALLLDKKNALKHLEESLKNNQIHVKHIEEDNDWDGMREDEDFKNLITKYKIQ